MVDGPGAVGSPGPSPGQACWEPGPRGRESTLGALLGAPDHRPRKKRHRRWQRYSARLPTAVEPGASPTHPSTSACVTARKPVLSQGHNPDQAASNSPEISCKLHRLPGHVRRTPAVRRAVVPEAADGQSADGPGSLQLPLLFLKAGPAGGRLRRPSSRRQHPDRDRQTQPSRLHLPTQWPGGGGGSSPWLGCAASPTRPGRPTCGHSDAVPAARPSPGSSLLVYQLNRHGDANQDRVMPAPPRSTPPMTHSQPVSASGPREIATHNQVGGETRLRI